MSKLNVDQKTIKNLLSDNKADFLIPDYQRPYAWDADKECQTLWEDVFEFAIPEGDANKFNRATDEYYLGPIVTFKNENGQMESLTLDFMNPEIDVELQNKYMEPNKWD